MNFDALKSNLEKYRDYKFNDDLLLRPIEKSIFKTLSRMLRSSKPDELVNLNGKYRKMGPEEKRLQEENIKKELDEMKEYSNNYYIPEFILYTLSNAHDDWILENKWQLEKNNQENLHKFVNFNLLPIEDMEKYMSVLKPILKALKIEYDEEKVRQEFERQQLVYLLRNEIFSEECLKDRIQNVKLSYPEMLTIQLNNKNEKTIQELFEEEKNANNIANAVSKKMDLNIANKIKKVLYTNRNNVGFILMQDLEERKSVYKFAENIGQKKIGLKKRAFPRPNKPLTKDLFELSRDVGIIFAKNIKKHDYKYYDTIPRSQRKVMFIESDKCGEEGKRQIRKRDKKIERKYSKIKKKNKLDTSGIMSIILTKKNEFLSNGLNMDSNAAVKVIQIPVTLRELYSFKLLPEEVGWERGIKSKINSSNSVLYVESDKSLEEIANINTKSDKEKNNFRDNLVKWAKDSSNEVKTQKGNIAYDEKVIENEIDRTK